MTCARGLDATEAGSSCRRAAGHFGVGQASAIRRHARFRNAGAWFEGQRDLDPDSLAFIDEPKDRAEQRDDGHHQHGAALWLIPTGKSCRIGVPHRHDKTTSTALRTNGLGAITPFDGATNGERFRTYVTDTLVPVLTRGDTAVLDNLPSHKVAGVREAIEAAGARGAAPLAVIRPAFKIFRPHKIDTAGYDTFNPT